MTSTPQLSSLNTSVYSPVRFPDICLSPKSPRNDPLGIRPKVRSIVKTIIENHKKWELAQKRGISLCCAIENGKKQALDPSETLYPDDLKAPIDKLKKITTIFKDMLDSSKECLSQLVDLNKLQSDSNEKPLKTWTLTKLVTSIETIAQAYEDEYQVKIKVLENVCHSSSKDEIVFHVSVWEFQTFVNDDVKFVELSIQVECVVEGKVQ